MTSFLSQLLCYLGAELCDTQSRSAVLQTHRSLASLPGAAAAIPAARAPLCGGSLSAGLLQGTVTSWLPVSSVRCKRPCASSGLHHFLTFCYDLEDALNSPPLGPMVGQGEGAAGCLLE